MEFIGWVGTFFLSCCGIPQVIASFKDDIALRGLTYTYLYGWIIGISCMAVYIHFLPAVSYPYPLQAANIISLTSVLTLTFMKHRMNKNVKNNN